VAAEAVRKPEPRGGEAGFHAATFTASDAHERSLVMTSPRQEQPSFGNFAELSEADCKELLVQHTAGRVGFMAGDGPMILPVTYQYRNGSVIFRTSPVGPLAGLVRRTSVAFEIDAIDEQNKSGWSVLVLGFAEAMAHDYLLTTAWESGPVPWADGVRNLFIEIKPRKISGRAVRGR
jgi:nitroimidazol reductase NimA-like FMN-containing flavoprotein (pyridoxamine 5'-phosphate oxidase superfamily)